MVAVIFALTLVTPSLGSAQVKETQSAPASGSPGAAKAGAAAGEGAAKGVSIGAIGLIASGVAAAAAGIAAASGGGGGGGGGGAILPASHH